MKGFVAVKIAWRYLKVLNRIAEALERAYPPPAKISKSRAEVLESEPSEENEQAEVDYRAGRIPWDVDETA